MRKTSKDIPKNHFTFAEVFLLLLGICLVLIAEMDIKLIQDHCFFSNLLSKIGEAFIVASILAFTVDFSLKKELVQEVLEKSAAFFVGYGLPKQIINEIDYLRELPLYLDEAHVEFMLIPAEGKPESMYLVTSFKYRVRNRTSTTQQFNHRVGQLKPQGKEHHFIHNIGASNVNFESKREYNYSKKDIEDHFAKGKFVMAPSAIFQGDDLWRFWERSLEIPSENDANDNRLPMFWASTVMEVPKLAGYHSHVLAYAVLGITCNTASTVKGIRLRSSIGHRNRGNVQSSGIDSHTLNAALLPGQVLFARWWEDDAEIDSIGAE